MPLGGLEGFAPQKMKQLRVRAGIPIDMIAVACGVTLGTARGWEAGRLTPSAEAAVLLARTLHVHVADLTTTPKDEPTLIQMRQWRGLNGSQAAEAAELGVGTIYSAERYVSPLPEHVKKALAKAYKTSAKKVDEAWRRGRTAKYGDLGAF